LERSLVVDRLDEQLVLTTILDAGSRKRQIKNPIIDFAAFS
jgi:hypothetical protein